MTAALLKVRSTVEDMGKSNSISGGGYGHRRAINSPWTKRVKLQLIITVHEALVPWVKENVSA